jgi:hypothetical protein
MSNLISLYLFLFLSTLSLPPNPAFHVAVVLGKKEWWLWRRLSWREMEKERGGWMGGEIDILEGMSWREGGEGGGGTAHDQGRASHVAVVLDDDLPA